MRRIFTLFFAIFFSLSLFSQDVKLPEAVQKAVDQTLQKVTSLQHPVLVKNSSAKLMSKFVYDSTQGYLKIYPDPEFLWYRNLVKERNAIGNYTHNVSYQFDTAKQVWYPEEDKYFYYYGDSAFKSYVYYRWDTTTNDWLDTPKIKVLYDERGQILFYQWYDSTAEEKIFYKHTTDYDEDLKLVDYRYMIDTYYVDSIGYVYWNIDTNTYNDSKLLANNVNYYFIDYYRTDFRYYRCDTTWTRYSYNDDNLIDTVFTLKRGKTIYSTYNWIDYVNSMDIYSYNDSGKVSEIVTYSSSYEDQEPQLYSKKVYIYGSEGYLDSMKYYLWDSYGNVWNLRSVNVYSYKNGLLTENTYYYAVNNDSIVPSYKDVYDYNDAGLMTLQAHLRYDTAWYYSNYRAWEYDEDNNNTAYLYMWDQDWDKQLDTAYYNLYKYDENGLRVQSQYNNYENNERVKTETYNLYYSVFTYNLAQDITGKLMVYPNPASQKLMFNNTDLELAEIYSLDGRLVKQQVITTNQIDISGLKTGTYIIRTLDKNGKAYVSKFIKQ